MKGLIKPYLYPLLFHETVIVLVKIMLSAIYVRSGYRKSTVRVATTVRTALSPKPFIFHTSDAYWSVESGAC
jgi:hypothetical protein